MRIGYGWDSHEFKSGVPLKIGGLELPHDKGLAGHSDGDVLLHALTDTLLGAVAAGDIGDSRDRAESARESCDARAAIGDECQVRRRRIAHRHAGGIRRSGIHHGNCV